MPRALVVRSAENLFNEGRLAVAAVGGLAACQRIRCRWLRLRVLVRGEGSRWVHRTHEGFVRGVLFLPSPAQSTASPISTREADLRRLVLAKR